MIYSDVPKGNIEIPENDEERLSEVYILFDVAEISHKRKQKYLKNS